MPIVDMLVGALSSILPKSSAQVEEDRNAVRYARVHGSSLTYVKGQVPESPFDCLEKKEEKPVRFPLATESDPAVIERHSAECRDAEGSHGGLCEMCKLLNNPKRFDFLVRLYGDERSLDQAGFNVLGALDGAKVNLSATSSYLRELAKVGLIRRERSGRLVNYTPDFSLAQPCVAEIAALLRDRLRRDPADTPFVPVFRAMMGSLRSRVVRHLAAGGCGNIQYLKEEFNILRLSDLERDLKPALEAHLLDLDSQDPDGTYTYLTPADPIARRVVELS